MSDPYYEATQRDRRGLPLWGKILLGMGGVAVVAFIAIVVAGVLFVRNMVDEVGTELEAMLPPATDATPAEVFADMTENVLGDEVTIVAQDESRGRVTLSVSGKEIDVDLSDFGEWVGEGLDVIQEGIRHGIHYEGKIDESVQLVRASSADGSFSFVARAGEDGGFLSISSGTPLNVSVGDDAARIPGWVPVYPGARVHEQLFSYRSEIRSFGGVVLVSDDGPEKIRRWYEENIGEGSSVRVSTSTKQKGDGVPGTPKYRARIVANDGKQGGSNVSIVVTQEGDEETVIMVVYKEKR